MPFAGQQHIIRQQQPFSGINHQLDIEELAFDQGIAKGELGPVFAQPARSGLVFGRKGKNLVLIANRRGLGRCRQFDIEKQPFAGGNFEQRFARQGQITNLDQCRAEGAGDRGHNPRIGRELIKLGDVLLQTLAFQAQPFERRFFLLFLFESRAADRKQLQGAGIAFFLGADFGFKPFDFGTQPFAFGEQFVVVDLGDDLTGANRIAFALIKLVQAAADLG